MSIFDPHGYYISRKYNTAKGQILQKKPIDPPYVYDIASNVSKLRSLGYTVYKTFDNTIFPSTLRSYFINYPDINLSSTTTDFQLIITYEDIISKFRQNYDFSFLNQYDVNSIKTIEFRLYSDCFSIRYLDNNTGTRNLTLTTSTIDNISIISYGYGVGSSDRCYFIQNCDEETFQCNSGTQIQLLNKSVQSQFLAGGVNVYQSLNDINNFISAMSGQIQFPGYFINVLYTDTQTGGGLLTLRQFPVRMDILIHFNV